MRLLVNSRLVETEAPPSTPLLDFLREDQGLVGTKEGCREGDCGACAVLVGEFALGRPRYRAHPSCLMSVGELAGLHLVTIEGLAEGADVAGLEAGLTPVMRALLEENGSQCGFCSPGFVVSLTAWLLEGEALDEEGAVRAVEGNLCRCTGYASIRRAAKLLLALFSGLPADPLARIEALTAKAVVPVSLRDFARGSFASAIASDRPRPNGVAQRVIGGGSDLYVREPHPSAGGPSPFYPRLEPAFTRIERAGDEISVGGAVTVRDFFASPLVRAAVPGIEAFEAGFASILVRNRATVAGNLVNASPVGDLTAILLGLGARLRITRLDGGPGERFVALDRFFLAYKKVDLATDELVAAVLVAPLAENEGFNFEKLSKRESLDIAAVNTAIRLRLAADGSSIAEARLSAGGVAALPRLLGKTGAFLAGRRPDAALALEAAGIAASEIEPIGDARGSAEYRRLALGRLVLAHFAALFPGRMDALAAGLGAPATAATREGS
jgi:xanthine dehydrogenase small subunit